MRSRDLSGTHLRFDPLLGAHTVTCLSCRRVAIVERGDRAELLAQLGALREAGWRRRGRDPLCEACTRAWQPEPRTPRVRAPQDPSLARATLRAYARHARGPEREWAQVLLREWDE